MNFFLVIRIVRSDVVWGKYGVPPDQYGGTESDGFQENVNSGATAAIAWGFFGTARGILSTYRLVVRTTCWNPDLAESSLRFEAWVSVLTSTRPGADTGNTLCGMTAASNTVGRCCLATVEC